MWGVESDVTAVEPVETGCVHKCAPPVYRSPMAILCRALFGAIPPGIISENQIPNVDIWKDGVTLDGITAVGNKLEEFSFTIEEDNDSDPKPSDVIFYNGRFYVIGEVKTVEDPYLEIEPEVLWVWPNLESTNDVYSNLSWRIK